MFCTFLCYSVGSISVSSVYLLIPVFYCLPSPTFFFFNNHKLMLKVCEAVSVYELVHLKDSSIPRVCDSLLSLSDGFVQYCKLSVHPRS